MLAFDFLSLQMIVEIGIFSLQYTHHLVYFNFQSIELASVHVGEVVVHEVFEDEVNMVSVVGHFEDVFAEVVHALEVAHVLVVECVYPQGLHQVGAQALIPAQWTFCIQENYLRVFTGLRHLLDHPLVDLLCVRRAADLLVQLQSALMAHCVLVDQVTLVDSPG